MTHLPRPVPPPADLSEEAKALWRATQRALRRQDTWQDSDAPTLERYVRAVERARDAREAAEAEPWVRGSKGQPVAHPGFRVARDAELDAQRYAESLLLTPRMRRRHDVAPRTDDELLEVLR